MFDIKPARLADTAEFTFHRLSPDPANPIKIRCRHYGVANPVFMNAEFERDRKGDLVERKGAEQAIYDRDLDIANIAHYCATEWNVTRGGAAVECTPANVIEFLKFAAQAYPDEINLLRTWSKLVGNFRETASAEDLGKK